MSPVFWELLAPSRTGTRTGAKGGFLHVEAVLGISGAAPQHAHSRRRLRRNAAHPQMRLDARPVGQRDERIVVHDDARAAPIELRVHGPRRAKEGERLIDQVAAEIVEKPSGFFGRTVFPPSPPWLWPPALES